MSQTETLMARDGHEFGAYIARPAGRARGAIVVLQEIFGVNHHIRAVADRFADAGWLAIAPALFDRVAAHAGVPRQAPGLGPAPARIIRRLFQQPETP